MKEAVIKSCMYISEVSCYEVVKDFSGPIAALVVAICSVRFALHQISIQHKNTLKAQLDQHNKTLSAQDIHQKNLTRIEIFKELGHLLDQSHAIISNVKSYCFEKKYSGYKTDDQIDPAEYEGLLKKSSDAMLDVILTVERYEIFNFLLFRVFRFSLQSVLHDFNNLRFNKDRSLVLDRIIELTGEASMYYSDFQVCLQNMTYGDIFLSEVPDRNPPDKSCKVITMDNANLKELLQFFSHETEWGKSCDIAIKEAEERFS